MLKVYFILIIICEFFGNSYAGRFLAITKNGRIRGHPGRTYKDTKYIEFLGVPYAQPPLGVLRFEDPEPVAPWNGIMVANDTTQCLQFDSTQDTVIGSEDCLHLNIYVHGERINANNKLDVIVHIHPGLFTYGSGSEFSGPKYLMDTDVILVSMNYRLGLFGFLSTEDENMPGNRGMKDQVMALTWIKENINAFGGNPDSVTITGAYAGAASVNFHAISPLSRGLFHKAIIGSESVFSPFNIQDVGALKRTRLIAKNIGCNLKKTKDVLTCFKSRNARQIIQKMKKTKTWVNRIFTPLGVVIDKWSAKPFLPEDPIKVLKNGNISNVPFLISSEYNSGSWILNELKMQPNFWNDLKNNWERKAPFLLQYEQSGSNINEVSGKIREFYFKDGVDENNEQKMIELLSDRFYLNANDVSARLISQATSSSVFFYYFKYNAREACQAENFSRLHNTKDMSFIFSNCDSSELSEDDDAMKEFLIRLWINFIKTGRVLRSHNWLPVSKNFNDPLNLMYISNTYEQSFRSVTELGNKRFWSSLGLNENYLNNIV